MVDGERGSELSNGGVLQKLEKAKHWILPLEPPPPSGASGKNSVPSSADT